MDSYPHNITAVFGRVMKTIQMTIEEQLLTEVDQLIAVLDVTRSAFIRDALQAALRKYRNGLLEEQHKSGYKAVPMKQEEVEEWSDAQVWGEG